ncbi:MAG: Gfo/Idh/MocA family oxidoreductase [Proteobacteria bacterium]|nr:Gfo/Idh/MocA family oxidoreductase [Pseudomonadota bacterium]
MTNLKVIKVGIIGCGLIGQKRAKALAGAELVACSDKDPIKCAQFAQQNGKIKSYQDWRKMLDDQTIDVVVIATPHNTLAEMTLQAMQANKHVLVEKPAACYPEELEPLFTLPQFSKVCVRVGFNHRYHRSLQKAKQLINQGMIGDLMYIRARYGHGGRIGYDQEWRADPAISGGGELLDQGVHLIDLARWFLGEFVEQSGFAHTYFWNMPVDDNGFLLLKTAQKQVAFLHASCTEWKNIFSMEIYGRQGKLVIEGLGGSYGVERLILYKMLPEMGPPETTIWEYPMADNSWQIEFADFLEDIRLQRPSNPGLKDAYEALKIVHNVYKECQL